MERPCPNLNRRRYQSLVCVNTPNIPQYTSVTYAKHVPSSNEPDSPAGANLSPSQCVAVYRKYMQPYYGTVQLGTPAVTNGGGQAGLTYLDNFASICTGCAFNFVNVHFFVDRSEMSVAQYVQALKDYVDIHVPAVQAKHEQLNGLPIAIGKVRPSIPSPFFSPPYTSNLPLALPFAPPITLIMHHSFIHQSC